MIAELALDTDSQLSRPKKYNIFNDVIEDNVMSSDTLIFGEDDDIISMFDERHYKNNTANVILFYSKKKKENSFEYIPSIAFNQLLTEKWLTINKIKSQIILLQETKSVECALDYVFDTFDDLLLKGKFDLCNSFFENIDMDKLEINTLVGILTITSAWKEKLTMRESFYQQVSDIVNSRYLSDEAKQILIGLE